MNHSPTKRAPDVWDSAAFSSIFLASGFSCSQTESTPAHTQVTQAVRCCEFCVGASHGVTPYNDDRISFLYAYGKKSPEWLRTAPILSRSWGQGHTLICD